MGSALATAEGLEAQTGARSMTAAQREIARQEAVYDRLKRRERRRHHWYTRFIDWVTGA